MFYFAAPIAGRQPGPSSADGDGPGGTVRGQHEATGGQGGRGRHSGKREAAIPGSEQSPEATRLAQKSAQEFAAGNVSKAQELAGDSALAVAYTHLQRIVGVMAILLPFVLFSGNWALTGSELESSISAYYHTPVGSVFVGVLSALGVFFLSYNFRPLPGFNLDNKLSTLASIAAVCVAVFPTTSDASVATRSEKNIGIVHMVSAGLLFTLLAIFALFLFPRSSGAMTPEKRRRNIAYRTCGGIMAAAILSMFPSQLLPDSWHAFLWLETLCVLAFGTSWLIKGGFLGILADKTHAPAPALSATG